MDTRLAPLYILATLLSIASSKPYDASKLKSRSSSTRSGKVASSLAKLGLDDKSTNRCETVPFEVTIAPRGCEPVTYQNNYCTGFCTSYFVPPKAESCNVCKPAYARKTLITLQCLEPRGNRMVKIPKLQEVTIVMKCKCGSCHKNE